MTFRATYTQVCLFNSRKVFEFPGALKKQNGLVADKAFILQVFPKLTYSGGVDINSSKSAGLMDL
jgi:hypothetical protein